MTELEEAILAYAKLIVLTGRPFTYRDFMNGFSVNGVKYTFTKGTFKVKMCKLQQKGLITKVFQDRYAWYTLPGFSQVKPIQNKIYPVPVGSPTGSNRRKKSGMQSSGVSLSTALEGVSFHSRPCVHNIHVVTRSIANLYNVVSQVSPNPPQPRNKSIEAQAYPYQHCPLCPEVKVRVIACPNDTLEIRVACSPKPLILSREGIYALDHILAHVRTLLFEFLRPVLDQLTIAQRCDIPLADSWIIVAWHLNVDSDQTVVIDGGSFRIAWKTAKGVLMQLYGKKEIGNRVRVEIQEPVNKTVKQLKEIIKPITDDEYMEIEAREQQSRSPFAGKTPVIQDACEQLIEFKKSTVGLDSEWDLR